MQRFAPLFAASTLVVAIVAGYLFLQLRAEHLRSRQLQERLAQLEFAQGAIHASVAVAPAVTGSQPAPASSAGQVAAAGLPGQNTMATEVSRPNAARVDVRDLLKDPDFRAAQLAQRRAQLQRTYAALVRELQLTPAQADALFDLMAKQQLARMSEPARMVANGQVPGEEAQQAMRNAIQENRRAQDAEIATLLGDAAFVQFKEYQDTLGARQRVTQLRAQLAAQGQLLTEEQFKPLITAVAAEQKLQGQQMADREPSTRGNAAAQLAYREQSLKATEESNRRLVRAASPYLDSTQLEALAALLEQDLAMLRANLRVQQARMEAQGRSEDQ